MDRVRRPSSWLLEHFDGRPNSAGQFLAAAIVVVIGTVTAVFFYQVFDLTRLAIFFFGSVIVSALFFGARPGVFAAFLAFIAYNFSLVEPRFTFQFAGANDALTLSAFLSLALLIGGLAGRVRESERANRRRADLLEALLEASRAFSSAGDAPGLRAELTRQLQVATGADAHVLTGDDPEIPDAQVRTLAKEAAMSAGPVARGPWRARPLSPDNDLGVAVWRMGEGSSPELQTQSRLCNLLTDLGAAALDRIRLVDLQAEAEAGARAGRLRDAILGSISHDLRTPLATVLASASSLRDYDDRFDSRTRRNLADGIVQEADRLNAFVKSLLDLSRIEVGHLAPSLTAIPVLEIVDAAVGRVDPSNARVRLDDIAADLEVEADAALLQQVVVNLIDNALIHGGPDVRVDIRAALTDDGVVLSIEDDGVGVAADEIDRLFDKFYRGGRRNPDVRGTGIGLSIAKGFIEAMGGSIHLTPGQGGTGLCAIITLNAAGGANP